LFVDEAKEGSMRKGLLTAVGLATAMTAMVAVPVVSAGASSSTQGVTAKTIRVGVPTPTSPRCELSAST